MKPIDIKYSYIKGYSVAPYNFISLPKEAIARYKHPNELPAHNNFTNRDNRPLLSGTIEYTLEAMAPIIISSGIKDNEKDAYFFTNLNGEYAIPGNTIRGVVRTNTQILGCSNIIKSDEKGDYAESEIQDSRFLFRDIAGNGSLAKKYKEILNIDRVKRISRNLKAGYIVNENNQYYIQESEKLNDIRNYFRVDELYLRQILDKGIIRDVKFMYKPELSIYEEEIKELNKKIHGRNLRVSDKEKEEATNKKKAILNEWKNNKGKDRYRPYIVEVSFNLDSKNAKIIKIGVKGKYIKTGFLLSGGFIDGKLAHYLVPDPLPSMGKIPIKEEDIKDYKDDLVLTKKMTKSETIIHGNEFFNLPSKGEIKPIFFIHTDRLHFGFTPNLRMFYSKTVLDGVPSTYKDVKGISYTDAIFGFTNMKYKNNNGFINHSYKSRVSFEDAVAQDDATVDNDSTMKMILAEPKATSYNLYLKQDDVDKNSLIIYEGDFHIRGIKQYWLKDYIERPKIEENQNDNMTFTIHPLKEGTRFSGKIHFNNLEGDELGLFLWALKLEDNCYQNIGLAKPYGFGRVKIKDIKLKIEDLDKKYSSFSFDYFKSEDISKYIDLYKEKLSKTYLNGKPVYEEESIKELIFIKSKVIAEKDADKYRYMRFKPNEFRYRNVLPTILKYEELQKNPNIKKQDCNNNLKHKSHDNQKSYINQKQKSQHNYKNQKQDSFASNIMADAFKTAENRKRKKK